MATNIHNLNEKLNIQLTDNILFDSIDISDVTYRINFSDMINNVKAYYINQVRKNILAYQHMRTFDGEFQSSYNNDVEVEVNLNELNISEYLDQNSTSPYNVIPPLDPTNEYERLYVHVLLYGEFERTDGGDIHGIHIVFIESELFFYKKGLMYYSHTEPAVYHYTEGITDPSTMTTYTYEGYAVEKEKNIPGFIKLSHSGTPVNVYRYENEPATHKYITVGTHYKKYIESLDQFAINTFSDNRLELYTYLEDQSGDPIFKFKIKKTDTISTNTNLVFNAKVKIFFKLI